MSEDKTTADASGRAEDEENDLRERFPDPETDARLKTPRGDALPEAPTVKLSRPAPSTKRSVGEDRLEQIASGLRGAGAASTIGITLVVCIFIGTGLGWMVDRYLLGSPQPPWGLLVGFLLGTISGFVQVVRTANELNKDQ